DVLAVTNEVGSGIVPEHFSGRLFRDLAGKCNQLVAARADELWFTVCGIPRRFK
ncbi:MAG: bifunctional adenosylcobinamide kinase/adenosylcobinamide-phosphate guanylyltransferase, partial [Firmicutes bacterium]|nr:bifunctional adenosylcobinamide kinase/adenosylcobinamide-phosphate guanylyltransferase [Bacillota bacterium]